MAAFSPTHSYLGGLGSFPPPVVVPGSATLPRGFLDPVFGFGSLLPAQPAALQWIGVTDRFTRFHQKLAFTETQQGDGLRRAAAVLRCLNRHYYGEARVANGFLIGSWSKELAIRPPRDIDLYFELPAHVHARFERYQCNRQSALLQEVKGVLAATYPQTRMRGDGQVVVVDFNGFTVEVVPSFLLESGRYWVCDTHDGGSYAVADPIAERLHLERIDAENSRNLRPLIRMLKAWQASCSVPLSSFQLELLASAFIQHSRWRNKSFFYFDWIVRDFFAFLYAAAPNKSVIVPGTGKPLRLGSAWQSRALTAYRRAAKACIYERDNLVLTAGEEWQKIFGPDIPRSV